MLILYLYETFYRLNSCLATG